MDYPAKKITHTSEKGNEYILEREKGTGRYSTVWKAFDAFDVEEENPVAIKAFLPDEKGERLRLKRIMREIRSLHLAAGSLHVVSCLDYSLNPLQPYLVLEYVPQTLQDRFNYRGGITQGLIMDYLLQIPELLSFFRDRHIAHCDLKATNMGYANRIIKALDLGEAVEISYKEREGFVPPGREKEFRWPYYNPPEMRDAEYRLVTTTSDVYSAGKLLQHLLIGSHQDISTAEALAKIEERFGVRLPRSFTTLLTAMTQESYPARPSPEDLRMLARYAAKDLEKEEYFNPARIKSIRFGGSDGENGGRNERAEAKGLNLPPADFSPAVLQP